MHAYEKMTFPQHLEVLKGFYCTTHACGQAKKGICTLMVLVIPLGWDLDT